MTPLKKYISHKSFQVYKPKEVVFRYIIERMKGCNSTGNNIQIKLRPASFDAFAPRGTINLSFTNIEEQKQTQIDAEIIPLSFTREGVYIISGTLSLFVLTAVIVSFTWGTFIVIIFGLVAMALIVHWAQLLNEGKLENLISHLIAETKSKANSIA